MACGTAVEVLLTVLVMFTKMFIIHASGCLASIEVDGLIMPKYNRYS